MPGLSGSQEKDQYLGGWIGAAFFLVGAPAAILMGYFSHGYNRCTMFFWVVILGAHSWHCARPDALANAVCYACCLHTCSPLRLHTDRL